MRLDLGRRLDQRILLLVRHCNKLEASRGDAEQHDIRGLGRCAFRREPLQDTRLRRHEADVVAERGTVEPQDRLVGGCGSPFA